MKVIKEELTQYEFCRNEVLTTKDLRQDRQRKLFHALRLGNLYKCHVKIWAKDINNKRISVETTVWAVTEKYVVLKRGLTIPINRIFKVDLV